MTTEEKLRRALNELEALKIEKARGKQGWAIWHDMKEKRLGLVSVSIELFATMTDEEWNVAFKDVRILQAIPDVFKGTVEYWCSGPMFEVCEAYSIPKYIIMCERTEDGLKVKYEKV